MDLWQFCCYMDGYNIKKKTEELDSILLALRISEYSAGNAFVKRKKLDAKGDVDKLITEIEDLFSGQYYKKIENEQKVSDEEQIERLKKQLKYFN